MNIEQVESNLKVIRQAMDLEVTQEDIDGILGKMNSLQVLEGLSSECMRWAKKLRLDRQHQTLKTLDILKCPATSLKILLEDSTIHEQTLEVYAERLNAGLHHTVDGLRSMVSFYKESLITNRWQKQP